MRKHLPRRLIAASLLLAACTHAAAYEITGKVIKVADGDTITIMEDNHNKQKIRLADIDAPEKGQPYGNKSKQYLAALVAGKYAKADCRETDRYGRHVCTIYIGDLDVNADMIISGNAWVFTKYNRRKDLPNLEKTAKAAKRGLWGLSEAENMEPSQWRKKLKG